MGKRNKDAPEEVDITESENTYERMPKKYLDKPLHYPNEDLLKIKLTFRMIITGETGSGKTNVCAQIVRKIGVFTKILLFAKDLEEPIYKYLVDTVHEIEKETGLEVLKCSNDIDDLPEVSKLNKKDNTLVIIDDMVNEKSRQLAKVTGYFTKGRHFNASTIFLTQTYFGTPPDMRKNSGYFVFTKLSTNRDFRRIGRDFESTQDEDLMAKMFQVAVKDKGGFPHFLMIDVASNDPQLLFRADFKPIDWIPPDPNTGQESVVQGITQDLTTNTPSEQKENSTDQKTGQGMSTSPPTRTDPSSSSLKVDEQESSDEVEGAGVKRKRKRKASTKKKSSTKKKPAPPRAKKAKVSAPAKRVPSRKPKAQPASTPRGRKGRKLPSGAPVQVVISNVHHSGYTSRVHEGAPRQHLLDRRGIVLKRIDTVLKQLASHMHDDHESDLKQELADLNAELLRINQELANKFGGVGIAPSKLKRKPMGHGIVHMPARFYETVRDPMDAVRKARQAITYMTKTGQIS